MKAAFLTSLFALGATNAFTQTTPFNTTADIDIANIRAGHLVHGDMWWNPATGTPACEYPKGSGKNVSYLGALWMSGFDPSSNLVVSAQEFRQNGTDYWPGPIDTTTIIIQKRINSQNWARIWKINAVQVDSFVHHLYTASTIPKDMVEWPAKGNPNAKGASTALTISQSMAPFVDVNADGVYNTADGDFPKIKGDQMLWWIYSDFGITHSNNSTGSFMVEIKQSAYAYKRGTIADDIIFYEYDITNKSSKTYSGFRMGLMTDAELGASLDDYVGFDSSHRMGFVYNGTSTDVVYGTNPPVAGITFLEFPGDMPGSYVPAGSFMHYTNMQNTPSGNPIGPLEHWRIMNSSDRVGTPLPNGRKYSAVDKEECVNNDPLNDRRYAVASNDITFSAGSTKKMTMALVISPDGGGCPNTTLTGIRTVADTAWNLYRNPPTPAGINTPPSAQALHIYPNPVNTFLYIDQPDGSKGNVTIYDAVGRNIGLKVTTQGIKMVIDTRDLPSGLYNVVYRSATVTANVKFVKE
jgi:hypothetical protein